MLVTLSGIFTLFREDLENALSPMDVAPAGMSMRSNSVQSSNADEEIRLTPSPKLTFFSLWQNAKVIFSMHVTFAGMLMVVKLSHPQNASAPMCPTLLGIFTVVRLEHPANALFPICIIPAGIVMLVKLLHSQKVDGAMRVIPTGMFTVIKLLQP